MSKEGERSIIGQVVVLKRAACLRPGVPDGCRAKLMLQRASLCYRWRSSLSGSSVMAGRLLGDEVAGGSRRPLAQSTAGVAAAGRLLLCGVGLTVLIFGDLLLLF
jgi:hypothetical protein